MVNVILIAAHFDKDSRYVPEGTAVNVAVKDLNVWQKPADAAAKVEMDKKFTPSPVVGYYKKGTL